MTPMMAESMTLPLIKPMNAVSVNRIALRMRLEALTENML